MKKHEIAAGETFQTLAARNDVPIEAIVRANPGVDPRKLQLRQVINIPEAADLLTEISGIKTPPGKIKTVDDLSSAIDAAALQYSIRSDVLRGLVSVESKGNPIAGSSVGAKGLTQIMDSTSKALGVTDPHDINQNLAAGAAALQRSLKEAQALKYKNRWPGYGIDQDWEYALMIYHAGAPAVQGWLAAGAPVNFDKLTLEQRQALQVGPLTISYPKKVFDATKKSDPFPGFKLYIKQQGK